MGKEEISPAAGFSPSGQKSAAAQVLSFDRQTSGFQFLRGQIKNLLFRSMTKNSSDLFLRGGDVISVNPQTHSVHEPDLTSFIDYCAKCGYDDFLLDVGANVGLTTCQSGRAFQKIVCFEPNPVCLHILKANIDISDLASRVEVREFGLGEQDGALELWVPRRNFGGAFVRSSDNSYEPEVLAAKDGFASFDESAYLKRTIAIRASDAAFAEEFQTLSSLGLTSGVIKIDVEGMERTVLKGLARALPAHFNCVIVFENFDPRLDLEEISSLFPGQVTLTKLSHQRPFKHKVPRAVQALCLMFLRERCYIDSAKPKDPTGDLVLVVGEQASPTLS